MRTIDSNKIHISKKLVAKISYLTLIIVVMVLFWILRDRKVESMIRNQQIQVSQTIINTINEQAKLDLITPNLFLIGVDSNHKRNLNDSIYKRVSRILTKKYLSNTKINPNDLNFKPFYIFSDAPDKNGNYNLTKNQLEELKNHIQFITIQIDKAVLSVKDELGKDIERLNTWVSIWIGIIGFLGIFIPIVLNYKSNEDLKELKISAENAVTKVEGVHCFIEENKEDIKELKLLPIELKDLKLSFNSFKEEVTNSKTISEKAIEKANKANVTANKAEMLVTTLNNISKIKDIDPLFLLYNDKPLETLSKYLIEIHLNLSNCSELFADSIIKDVFRQLALKLHLIAPSAFIGPVNFDLLNQFALEVSNVISNEISQERYNELLILLEKLNLNLTRT